MVENQPCPRCLKILTHYGIVIGIVVESYVDRYKPYKSWTITGKGGSTVTIHIFKCPVCGKGWRKTE